MKKIIAFVLLLVYSEAAFACSTFLLNKDGQLVFGRNYDWVSGNGMLVVNTKGVKKMALVAEAENPASWISKWGSVTFNQFGKEFPHGGMNEAGLVIELMWLDETAYPAEDKRQALSELQWIQYQLDNFSKVEEVIASDQTIRISRKNAVPLHFLVADASGDAASIEFINGKLVAHRGKDLAFPVLTNTTYDKSIRQVTDAKQAGSFADNSVQRFATACNMVTQFQKAATKEAAVDYAFNILDKVAQGDYTKWRIAYDITKREIHFITGSQRKMVSLSTFHFDCSPVSLFLDVNTKKEGNVTSFFTQLSFEENKRMLQKSAMESRSEVPISEESIKNASEYIRQLSCGK
jgi:penicillin V acylase-like amidase (Ntn superfamily)